MAASPWISGTAGRVTPDPAPALVRVALQAGSTSVAHVDVAAMLSGLCVALVPAAGVGGATLLLREPADPRDPEGRRVFGSDTAATRLGELQRRADAGPGPAAERGDRVLLTPDLTRSGPPELAAAAADCGLVRSLAVPVPIAGRTGGVLQLFARGGPKDRLTEDLADALRAVVTALAARIADVREIARLEQAAAREAGTGTSSLPGAPSALPGVPPGAELRGTARPGGPRDGAASPWAGRSPVTGPPGRSAPSGPGSPGPGRGRAAGSDSTRAGDPRTRTDGPDDDRARPRDPWPAPAGDAPARPSGPPAPRSADPSAAGQAGPVPARLPSPRDPISGGTRIGRADGPRNGSGRTAEPGRDGGRQSGPLGGRPQAPGPREGDGPLPRTPADRWIGSRADPAADAAGDREDHGADGHDDDVPPRADRTALIPVARRSGGTGSGPQVPAQRRARHRRRSD
ncbi:hypothetical protein FRP1_14560 [Pseudonocardia sp. EC080625-04]|nr:hypothetical protein FRP1_14560 [Pseudonocardia sp. EC080625-04]